MNNDNVRNPDSVFKDCLIQRDSEDESDDEIKLALSISMNEYKEEYINNNEKNNEFFDENQYFEDNELKLALEISEKEYEDQILKIEETRLLNIENRKKSLEFFSNIIKKLSFTEEDIKLKNIIIPLLEEYYDLKTDFLFLEENIYTKLYTIFDSYYLIPNKKGKITKITKEEDEIVRNIFLLKVN